MKIEEFQQVTKSINSIANALAKDPVGFVSKLIRMYLQSEKERDAYKSERDSLIADITRLRAERDMYKRKLDDVVDLFTRHINYKLSVTHNVWYINLRHKLDEVLKDDPKQ